MPLITVITVIYNLIEAGRKETFLQMLESVKNQDYPFIEHIIVDGNSLDGTKELIDSLSLNYISEHDEGLYDAMNKGISLAKGKYITFLNSDDFYHDKRALSECVKKLEKDSLDFVSGNNLCIFEGMPEKNYIWYSDFSTLFEKMPFGHQGLVCKTEIMRKHLFDLTYKIAADYDFVFKLLLFGYKGAVIPFTFATFRIGGMCNSRDAKHENKLLYKKYAKYKRNFLYLSQKANTYNIPVLTIITLCHNTISTGQKEKLLSCMESVGKQSYPYIEHLLVDQNSTDNTHEFLLSLKKDTSNLTIAKTQENYEKALESAIKEAKGDYILILSPFSTLSSDESIHGIMEKFQNEKIQIVYSDIKIIEESGEEKEIIWENLWKREDFLSHNIPYQAVVYDKTIFRFADFSKGKDIFDDLFFHCRLFLEKGYAYAYTNKELACIPAHELNTYLPEDKEETVSKFRKYIGQKSVYDRFIWKRRITFCNIKIVRITESMWESKYDLFGVINLITRKK